MSEPVDFAWQMHAATLDWTSKADTKAGLILAFDGAALSAVIGLSTENAPFSDVLHLEWWLIFIYLLAVVLLILSGVACLVAITPSLRSAHLEKEAEHDYIYFGHLRYWTSSRLYEALDTGDHLQALTNQLTRIAGIAWRKHQAVCVATWTAGPGVLLVMLGLMLAV